MEDKVITKRGFQLIIRSGSVSKKIKEATVEALNKIAQNYEAQIIKNISLSDHSLDDLEKLKHPYASDKPEGTLHGDDRMLHVQSGDLINSLSVHAVEETTKRRFTVYISSDSPYIKYLIFGTSFMRPRNFPQKSYEEIKATLWNPLYAALSKIEYRIEELK